MATLSRPTRSPADEATLGDALRAAVRAPYTAEGTFPALALTALRVIAGLMLAQHGAQKLFGFLAPPDRPFTGAPELLSQMWTAGVLEFVGGLLLAIGLLVRPTAFVLSGLMAVAYFLAHAPRGFWPLANQGELAALYSFVFLAFCALGAGPWSIDGLLARRRA